MDNECNIAHCSNEFRRNETEASFSKVQELTHALDEKQRDLELAAAIGQKLLDENRKLKEDLEEMQNLNNIIQHHFENACAGANEKGTGFLDETSGALMKQNEKLTTKNRALKKKSEELWQQLETSEKLRFQVVDELQEMQKEIQKIKKDFQVDQEKTRTLQEIVETQKAALEEYRRITEEDKKKIKKLEKTINHNESYGTRSNSINPLSNEVIKLRKSNEKAQNEIAILEQQNTELTELLKDKEQMVETIQYLIEENKRYRKELQETLDLLNEAKRNANELREKLEESSRFSRIPNRSLASELSAVENESLPKTIINDNRSRTIEEDSFSDLDSVINYLRKTFDNPQLVELVRRLQVLESHIPSGESAMSCTEDLPMESKQRSISVDSNLPLTTLVAKVNQITSEDDEKFLSSLLPSKSAVTENNINEGQMSEDLIQLKLNDFKLKSKTLTVRARKSKFSSSNDLLEALNNKLKSAESRLVSLNAILQENRSKQKTLEELNLKFMSALQKVQMQEERITELQLMLEKSQSVSTEVTQVKTGWLTKRGNFFPSWRRRWFSLSGLDYQLYYSKTATDRFLGAIILKGATVQCDLAKKYGRDWCFVINTEMGGKRAYALCADSENEMNEWIEALEEKIKLLKAKEESIIVTVFENADGIAENEEELSEQQISEQEQQPIGENTEASMVVQVNKDSEETIAEDEHKDDENPHVAFASDPLGATL